MHAAQIKTECLTMSHALKDRIKNVLTAYSVRSRVSFMYKNKMCMRDLKNSRGLLF